MLAPYRKFVVAFVGALAAYAARRWDIGPDSADTLVAFLTAVGVFGVQNVDPAPPPAWH